MIVQALFEAEWDTGRRCALLPVADGDLTLFADDPGCGWQLVDPNWSSEPPTATVLIATSPAVMADLKADASLLWLSDMGSPIHDEPMVKPGAQGVNAAVAWLKAHGYSGQEFGAAISEIAKSNYRTGFTIAVLLHLHGTAIEGVEAQKIGP